MRTYTRLVAALAIVAGLTLPVIGQSGPSGPAAELHAANLAWDRGDYPAALEAYLTLLAGPSASEVLEPIALQTGELFQTEELTADGASPQFSPDGRHIAYEVGSGSDARTRIVAAATGHAQATELPGTGAVFSPAGDKVAYLKRQPSPELTAAEATLAEAQPQGRRQAMMLVAWLSLRHTAIVEHDLASGRETELPTGGLLKTAIAYGAKGDVLYFIGADEQDDSKSDIYAATPGGPTKVTDTPGVKSAMLVDPTGAVLVYDTTARNPFRRPAEGGGQRGGGAGRSGGPGGGFTPSVGIVRLDTHATLGAGASTKATHTIEGSAPAMSADGSTLTYLTRAGDENAVVVTKLIGLGAEGLAKATTVKQTASRLAAPALSPDGSRVAYQMMEWFDWEIYVAGADGTDETRVTREIQHDVGPVFLTNDLVLASMGEPRHRRSSLYDLKTLKSTKLFHNNTIRTIAPEYQWVASLDASTLLVGAERDGDTVSPERGIYLVHLDRKVTREDVVARLETNLATEKDLRARGAKMFEPIATDVRHVVDGVSVDRAYEHEKALFDFDSKHISKPGNRLAGEYLFDAYRSFGYAPEYQWFEPRGALGGRSANVLATLTGTENPELVYVVSSHYDSNAAGPGADDDTSATAALVEAARALAGHPMPATIVFASFTGEESGLLGSREFVRQAVARKLKIVGALNNDMIGWANDQRLDNTIRYSNVGIRDVQHAAAFLFTKLITYDALYYKSTDAAAYYEAYGDIVGGIGSYPVLGNPHYHQPHDLLETINHELVAETAKTTAATLMLMASSPSRLRDLAVKSYAGGTADIAWAPAPEKGVHEYIVAVGLPGEQPRERLRVTLPSARIDGLEPGMIVAVKAVNARGLEGWDWARVEVR